MSLRAAPRRVRTTTSAAAAPTSRSNIQRGKGFGGWRQGRSARASLSGRKRAGASGDSSGGGGGGGEGARRRRGGAGRDRGGADRAVRVIVV